MTDKLATTASNWPTTESAIVSSKNPYSLIHPPKQPAILLFRWRTLAETGAFSAEVGEMYKKPFLSFLRQIQLGNKPGNSAGRFQAQGPKLGDNEQR